MTQPMADAIVSAVNAVPSSNPLQTRSDGRLSDCNVRSISGVEVNL